ncbi:phage baseplate assembly protein [Azorhizobium doebereinerae]|uniref:phage baseplate assembly protein n=1 Tax=Azorhizobium doebereinerae TaxID=281091 RepID=UPI00041A78E8|nr:phage baseplate assembly protein [Azorhizobium doebereinerae]
MPDRETAHQIRGLIVRGVVSATNDNAESQTADMTLFAGHDRAKVEVLQPFGIASRPPEKGGVCIVLAVGGDQGDLVALPVGAPSMRLGNLAEGEVALYTLDGSRVHIKADGSILAVSSKAVTCEVKGNRLEVTPDYVRGRMTDGSRFAAGQGWAKLSAGGHFIAASGAGVTCSIIPVVDSEPGAGV